MAELTPEIAPQVVEACTANAEEAAGALGRAFDGEFVLKPGEPTPRSGLAPEAFAGGGLLFTFKFGEESAVAALLQGSGLVPEWTKAPDPTGQSKLSTLAQELSMLLVPDTLMADVFEATWVDDLAAAVELAQPADDATAAPIEVAQGETLGQLTLVWPVSNVEAALGQAAGDPEPAEADDPTANEADESGAGSTGDTAGEAEKPSQSKVLRPKRPAPRDYRDLPPNSLTALRVLVPLSVNLASKKIKLQEVVEIGPGSILTFNNACDEPLEVTVGGRPIATGEAVKVGERFGVRVQQMILPDEKFHPMMPARRA